MSNNAIFSFGATSIIDPIRQEWGDRLIELAHDASPLNSARRSVTLTWNAIPVADFATIQGFDDGASHSVTIYTPALSSTTTYTGCYIRVLSGGRELGGLVYGASVEVWNINA